LQSHNLSKTERRGPFVFLTQDTTLPLKQGSLELSSEISSLTTLQERTQTVRDSMRPAPRIAHQFTSICKSWGILKACHAQTAEFST